MSRYYDVEGVGQLPSVTTILSMISKPALYGWYGKHGTAECKRLLNVAEIVGQTVHNAITMKPEKYIEADYREEVTAALECYHQFCEDFKPTFVAYEYQVISKKHRYAGTVDAIAHIQKAHVLIDWKTSSAIYPEYELQVEAYYRAYIEETPDRNLKYLLIVRLSKDTPQSYEIKQLTPNLQRFKAFLGIKQLFDWYETRKDKSHGKS